MLAHEHAERRWNGGVVRRLACVRHARIVGSATHEQTARAVTRAESEYHGIVLRLVDLIDSGACRAAVKLVDNGGEHSGIVCHFVNSFAFLSAEHDLIHFVEGREYKVGLFGN